MPATPARRTAVAAATAALALLAASWIASRRDEADTLARTRARLRPRAGEAG